MRCSLKTKTYYSGDDAARAVGITRRQLESWLSEDVIAPTGGWGSGPHDPHRFELEDLLRLRLLHDLRRLGRSRATLRKTVALLDQKQIRLEEGTATVVAFFDGRVAVIAGGAETTESGAVAFEFDCAREVAEMLSRMNLIGNRNG